MKTNNSTKLVFFKGVVIGEPIHFTSQSGQMYRISIKITKYPLIPEMEGRMVSCLFKRDYLDEETEEILLHGLPEIGDFMNCNHNPRTDVWYCNKPTSTFISKEERDDLNAKLIADFDF